MILNPYPNLYIVGTSHIAKQSVQEIKQAFQNNPTIIGVELDKQRLHALIHNAKPSRSPKMIKYVGVKGYFFALIGSLIQEKLGKMVGIKPGSEMLKAVQLAQKTKAKVLLLDRPIIITLKRFSQVLTWKEKGRFFKDILFPKSIKLKFALDKVPEEKLIETILDYTQERYPNLYKVLVEERNHYMFQRYEAAKKQHPDDIFLLVMGAGHIKGFLELLNQKPKSI